MVVPHDYYIVRLEIQEVPADRRLARYSGLYVRKYDPQQRVFEMTSSPSQAYPFLFRSDADEYWAQPGHVQYTNWPLAPTSLYTINIEPLAGRNKLY